MKFSVIIATYNRADDLGETLRSLAGLKPSGDWEVIIVDNNSSDHTEGVVKQAATWFPADLRYVFEREQGRSAALNAGIRAARGEIIATTDDDVHVEPDWLDAAARAIDELGADYLGGKALPIWGGPRPDWLPDRGGKHWGVIALLDYGPKAMELGKRVPIGVNMAFRRDAFARAGLWDNRVGRKAGTLLGQEVREWGLRAKAAGLRGFYAPGMVVHHKIPADRLNKKYFRRWFYWHGISRAMLYEHARVDMEAPEESALDYSKVPHVGGVPRYMYRSCLRMIAGIAKSALKGDPVATFENELWVWFFAGVVKQRWKDRKGQPALAARPVPGHE